MSNFIAQTATHTVTTTPAKNGGVDAPISIRKLMTDGILSGRAKEAIHADIRKFHETSAANHKFAKHYAWYKGTLKKEGHEIPEVGKAAPSKAVDPRARLAQLKAEQAALEAELEAADAEAGDDREGVEPNEDSIEAQQQRMLEEVERRLAELEN